MYRKKRAADKVSIFYNVTILMSAPTIVSKCMMQKLIEFKGARGEFTITATQLDTPHFILDGIERQNSIWA